MDLRVQRTKKNIINAFLKLRSKKPLEKISVKELAEQAEINKATFYLHYKDIYDLSEALENELIEKIFLAIEHPDAALSDPKLFARELSDAFISHRAMTDIVFSGGRNGIPMERMEKRIKDYIFDMYPELKNNEAVNILLTYSIMGGYYAFVENIGCEMDLLMSVIGDIAQCAVQNIIGKNFQNKY